MLEPYERRALQLESLIRSSITQEPNKTERKTIQIYPNEPIAIQTYLSSKRYNTSSPYQRVLTLGSLKLSRDLLNSTARFVCIVLVRHVKQALGLLKEPGARFTWALARCGCSMSARFLAFSRIFPPTWGGNCCFDLR